MRILFNEYYACVGEYILDDKQVQKKNHNQFLEFMRLNNYNSRICYSDNYDWDIYNSQLTVIPCFTVGKIYTSLSNDCLIDDNNNVVKISDDNEKNFVHLDFSIDECTRNFLNKLREKTLFLRISVEPISLFNFTSDNSSGLRDISKCKLYFKVRAFGCGMHIQTINLLEDDKSIRNAVYDMWKKCRINSKQCIILKNSLFHSKTTRNCINLNRNIGLL